MEQAGQKLVDKGSALADRPYEGYTGQRVAGLSGNEQLASQRAASLSSRYQPALDRANTQYSSGALDQYMNPYRDGVIDIGNERINRDFDSQLGALNRKRGMMDAFGSSRGTQLESALNATRSRALRENETQGLSTAFGNAQDMFMKDSSRNLDVAKTQAGLDTNELGALLETGSNERNVEQSQADFDYGQFLERRDWDVNNLAPLIAAIGGAAPTAGSTTKSETKESGGGLGKIIGVAGMVAGTIMSGGTLGAALLAGGGALSGGK